MVTPLLHVYRVLSTEETACRVWVDGDVVSVRFAATFPSPRVERVSPGHLVAVASRPNTPDLVVWRWYDAVVLGSTADGSVRLWEPAHGEVFAQSRASYRPQEPGTRAYASAGLPGAEWWVACSASESSTTAAVDLNEVSNLYTEHDLWDKAFDLAD
jgi:hypothetical protein